MKRRSLFYRIYFAAIGVFGILLAIGLWVFHAWLASYEAAQPSRAASHVIQTYLEGGHVAAMRQVCELAISPYETDERIDALLQDAGTLTAVTTNKRIEGCDAAFAVKDDTRKWMYLYFGRGDADRFGNRPYVLKKAEFTEDLICSVSLSMPRSAEVWINGKRLADSDRTDAPLPNLPETYFPDNMDNLQTAVLDGFINNQPVVTAKAQDVTMTVKQDDNRYTVLQVNDETQQQAVETLAVKAAQAYAARMQNDLGLAAVAPYFDTTTAFYENFRTMPVQFAWDHDSYSFKNTEVSDYYRYADTLFCCRVRFDQVLKLRSKPYTDHFDKILYVADTGKGLKVVDMQNFGGIADAAEEE